ncbi:MAG: helix-turn-helix transcriptional regulator [Clostridia bacterium]|nr:helix-turn-helix transcriptional regulator [Clostridia bacterium]
MGTFDRIFFLLNEKGITQNEFAAAIGVRKQAVTEWKNGTTKSYMKYIDKIAAFLGVSVDYLLNGTQPGSDPAAGTSFAEPQISKDLMAIIKYYNELSGDGQAKALEYIEMLRDRERKGYKNGKKE